MKEVCPLKDTSKTITTALSVAQIYLNETCCLAQEIEFDDTRVIS